MATEVQRILIKYEADIKQLQGELLAVEKANKEAGKSAVEAGKKTETAFVDAGKGAATAGKKAEVAFVDAGKGAKEAGATAGKALDDAGKKGKKAGDDTAKAFDKAGKEAKEAGSIGQKAFGGLTTILKGVGVALGAAFTVQAVISVGKELNRLQAEAQGVRQAFDNAFSPVALANLRTATIGTVSDLQLMKKALIAKEFGIPEDVLAKGLEFARVQANKLGFSIDFLTDSFVTGLGRKSPLILDNLGISTTKLNAKIAETGDFFEAVGAIIDETLGENAATTLETLSDRQARVNANFQNLKLELSDALLPVFERLTNAAGFFLDKLVSISRVGFVATAEQLAGLAAQTGTLAEQQIGYYTDLLASGEKTTDEVAADIVAKIKDINEQIAFDRKNMISPLNVADDISKSLGIFKRQQTIQLNLQATALNLTAKLDALTFTYNALGLSAARGTAGFDLQTATVKQLKEELDALGLEIELGSDRSAIAAVQSRQKEVQDRLDSLLGVVKAARKNVGSEVDLIVIELEKLIQRQEFRLKFGIDIDAAQAGLEVADLITGLVPIETIKAIGTTLGPILLNDIIPSLEEYDKIRQAQSDREIQRINDEIDAMYRKAAVVQQIGEAGINIANDIAVFAGKNDQVRFAAGLATISINTAVAASNQAVAISEAIKSSAGLPFPANLAAILLAVSTVVGFFAQIRQLQNSIEIPTSGFATGTSDAPGGVAWVGEKGPEKMYVPKGARVYTAKASKTETALIDALNAGNHKQFIADTYLKPFAQSLAMRGDATYDDFNLRQAIKGNKVIKLHPDTIRRLSSSRQINRYR